VAKSPRPARWSLPSRLPSRSGGSVHVPVVFRNMYGCACPAIYVGKRRGCSRELGSIFLKKYAWYSIKRLTNKFSRNAKAHRSCGRLQRWFGAAITQPQAPRSPRQHRCSLAAIGRLQSFALSTPNKEQSDKQNYQPEQESQIIQASVVVDFVHRYIRFEKRHNQGYRGDDPVP
jgi:hypothetical protein